MTMCTTCGVGMFDEGTSNDSERRANEKQERKEREECAEQSRLTLVHARSDESSTMSVRNRKKLSGIITNRDPSSNSGDFLVLPPSSTFQVTDDRREYWVEAHINERLVRMFPDYGSALNLISADYVQREHLAIENGTRDNIRLPDGRLVETSGTLDLSFRLASETRTSTATFTILRRCVHDFILSGTFLRDTQTLTTFKHRIQQSLVPSQTPIRVCLHGTPQERIAGSINGRTVFACPDTGSDVNVIRRDIATALGLSISVDPEATLLEFVDGSIVGVSGIVRHAKWRFGHIVDPARPLDTNMQEDKSYLSSPQWKPGTDATVKNTFICNFYVIENLSVPVILSSNLLYDTNAFVACAEHFQQNSGLGTSTQQNWPSVAVVKKVSKEVPKAGSVVKALKTSFYKLFGLASNGTGKKY
jgi:hypothetical protein